MKYIIAFFEKEQEELLYRVYLTDQLSAFTGTKLRFFDLLAHRKKPKDNRSGEQIAADVIKRCGLVVKS